MIIAIAILYAENMLGLLLQTLDLLSGVGGAFGFYMGLSIVAMFEVLEFLADLFYILCVKLFKPGAHVNAVSPQTISVSEKT